MKKKGKNILFIKMWGMGDAVLLLPILKLLKKMRPETNIIVLATSETSTVFQGYADKIIEFDFRLQILLPLNLLKTLFEVRNADVRIALDFEQFTRISSIMAFISGAEIRIGYCGIGKEKMYTKCINFNPDVHAVKSFADILIPIGITPKIKKLEPLKLDKKDKLAAESFIKENGIGKKIIGIHPGSGNTAVFRRWSVDKFAALSDRLIDIGYKIIATGTPSETELLQTLATKMKKKPVIANRLTLKQFAALVRKFDLFISNDTGAMHIAAAMGTPTLGIFGPNSPVRYAPFGKQHAWVYKWITCSPCIHVHKGIVPEKCPLNIDAQCIKMISVDEVFEKAKKMLKTKKRRFE
jgi:heptosyltransferase-2